MKAKHASWEQKIKFSNTIKKQQNVLKKLKLQQQLSEKKKKKTKAHFYRKKYVNS